jgi:CopG antitoxin of type II toxin-antitoxin system
MTENKELPKFDSIDELTGFFDENDLGDYLENLPEAEFEVNLEKRTYFVAVDEELSQKLSEIAKREHLPSEQIVNNWLREKISNYPEKV